MLGHVWKRVKLVTLVLVTFGVAAFTYPIWRDLTSSEEVTLLTNSAGQTTGTISLYIAPGATNDMKLYLISDYASETDKGGSAPTPTVELEVDNTEYTAKLMNPDLVTSWLAVLHKCCSAAASPHLGQTHLFH